MLRDRRFRVALELSILAHLLLAWWLPAALRLTTRLVQPRTVEAATAPEMDPIRFELVELPVDRKEEPSRGDAPASDLSRRAHGGEGPPADRPEVQGTSRNLLLTPPSSGVDRPQAPAAPLPLPAASAPASPTAEDRAGATDLVVRPTAPPQQRRPVLKGLSPVPGGPGRDGAVPDRRGGQVDLGPLSFDTQWYDWGPYAAEMLRRIRYHWRIPEIARLGVPGVTRVRFYIERNGRVSGVEVQRESGHPSMDFAARDAIANASPLPPLPPDLLGVEREGVTITFFYNTEIPEDDGR